jgi:tetratricopeptide (TPR) repeat protein
VLAGGALVLAVVAAYWNSLDAPFLFDDRPAVLDNLTIRQLWPPGAVLSPPQNGSSVVGRPLVNLSYALNYAGSGLAVRGYHATNIGLHILATLTLWGLLRLTLGKPGRPSRPAAPMVAWGAALLWAIHPLLTEAVVCVAQRNEIMVGLFCLFTLYAFARSTLSPAPGRWLLLAVGACLLGMASKEVMVVTPLLVLLYDRTFEAGTFREAWRRRRGFYGALAGTWLLLAWLVWQNRQRTGTAGFGVGVGVWEYLLTQCRALVLYLRLAVWPHPLVVDYGFDVVGSWREVLPQAVIVVALLLGTFLALRRRPVAGFVGGWFFLILAPSSSFVPLATQTIAEHRMYLPLLAVLVPFVAGLCALAGRFSGLLLGGLALALGGLTWQRNEVYRDEARLWAETIARVPDNARAYANLGNYLSARGRWAEAVLQYETAVRLRPDYADAQNNYADALAQTGRAAEAEVHYRAALRLKPGDATIQGNYAQSLARAGRWPEAVAQYEAILQRQPDDWAAHDNFGKALASHGRWPEAFGHFAAAVRLRPAQFEAHLDWGNALVQSGRLPEAIREYEAGLQLHPGQPDLLYNLGNVLLQTGRLRDAVQDYDLALQSAPQSPAVHHNLALALVRLGRSDEAVAHYEATLRQMPGSALVHQNLAYALEQSGRVADAIRQDEEALRLDPDLPGVREHLARLRALPPSPNVGRNPGP